jgi:hypothetical protein
MHAEHADGVRMNDSSRLVIGCAFTVLNRKSNAWSTICEPP